MAPQNSACEYTACASVRITYFFLRRGGSAPPCRRPRPRGAHVDHAAAPQDVPAERHRRGAPRWARRQASAGQGTTHFCRPVQALAVILHNAPTLAHTHAHSQMHAARRPAATYTSGSGPARRVYIAGRRGYASQGGGGEGSALGPAFLLSTAEDLRLPGSGSVCVRSMHASMYVCERGCGYVAAWARQLTVVAFRPRGMHACIPSCSPAGCKTALRRPDRRPPTVHAIA